MLLIPGNIRLHRPARYSYNNGLVDLDIQALFIFSSLIECLHKLSVYSFAFWPLNITQFSWKWLANLYLDMLTSVVFLCAVVLALIFHAIQFGQFLLEFLLLYVTDFHPKIKLPGSFSSWCDVFLNSQSPLAIFASGSDSGVLLSYFCLCISVRRTK